MILKDVLNQLFKAISIIYKRKWNNSNDNNLNPINLLNDGLYILFQLV